MPCVFKLNINQTDEKIQAKGSKSKAKGSGLDIRHPNKKGLGLINLMLRNQ